MWKEPTTAQVIVVIGFFIVALLLVFIGIRMLRNALKIKLGDYLPGLPVALILFGGTVFIVACDLFIYAFTKDTGIYHFHRLWFITDPTVGGLQGFWANPSMILLVIGIFTAWWGVPTPKKIRKFIGNIRSKKKRSETIAVALTLVSMVGGGIAGAFLGYAWTRNETFVYIGIVVGAAISLVLFVVLASFAILAYRKITKTPRS